MCLLIVLQGLDPSFPILVASNRDEHRQRLASPPGLWVGERRRVLSPRDRRAGGTWLGVNDQGMFAGLTNLAGAPARALPTSRGTLPHLALDQASLADAVAAVVELTSAQEHNAFQLVLADGTAARVLRHREGRTTVTPASSPVIVSNEHQLGELELPALQAALAPGMSAAERLDALVPILLDDGSNGGHRILKRGGDYGTVSSSLIAVPRDDPRRLVWRYAADAPDVAPYRDYGNLGRRLLAE